MAKEILQQEFTCKMCLNNIIYLDKILDYDDRKNSVINYNITDYYFIEYNSKEVEYFQEMYNLDKFIGYRLYYELYDCKDLSLEEFKNIKIYKEIII